MLDKELVDKSVAWLSLRGQPSTEKEQGGSRLCHRLFARSRLVNSVVVPRPQRAGLKDASEGPPAPPRPLVPHVWPPYVVQDPLRVTTLFRVHGVHHAPGVRDAHLVFVGKRKNPRFMLLANRAFPLKVGLPF